MIAYNLTRKEIHYRHDAFSAGLRAVGYTISGGVPVGRPGDLLLIWNRYASYHEQANLFEAGGGTVLVAENGYLGPGGVSPHAMNPREWYALGRGTHNDSTAIPQGGPERWNALGIELQPWRTEGEHILVCPNRSFGMPDRMMPPNWPEKTAERLRKLTKREVRVRPHPGNSPPKKPLAEDLKGAWGTVIWTSSAGVHSLIAGVPVICEAPYWICRDSAYFDFSALEMNLMYRMNRPSGIADKLRMRQYALERLAWGQWHLSEIESGEAFRAVLDHGL